MNSFPLINLYTTNSNEFNTSIYFVQGSIVVVHEISKTKVRIIRGVTVFVHNNSEGRVINKRIVIYGKFIVIATIVKMVKIDVYMFHVSQRPVSVR